MLISHHKLECIYRDTIHTLESCSRIISYQPGPFLLTLSLYAMLNIVTQFFYHFPLLKLVGNDCLCKIVWFYLTCSSHNHKQKCKWEYWNHTTLLRYNTVILIIQKIFAHRMGNTCKSMADSCQCMAKTTTILKSN